MMTKKIRRLRAFAPVFVKAVLMTAALICGAGCPALHKTQPLTGIRLFLNGEELGSNSFTIHAGFSGELAVKTDPDADDTAVVWELTDIGGAALNAGSVSAAAITGSSAGSRCTVRGVTPGAAFITVRAWRLSAGDVVQKTLAVTVSNAAAAGIGIAIEGGGTAIGVGETRIFTAELVPAWALGNVVWSAAPALVQLDQSIDPRGLRCQVTGLAAGAVTLTAAIGGVSAEFALEVKTPGVISGLSIFNGSQDVSGENIAIGLYEEISLSAHITPAETFSVIRWSSSVPDNVAADAFTGRIKGMTANSAAVITLNANNGAITKTVTVTVKNPVTGIRVHYDNAEGLPVSNTIRLCPGETVNLKAELAPAGISGASVSWSGNNAAVGLSAASGTTCAVTGIALGSAELLVVAQNAGTAEPAAARVPVVVEPAPIWAWDRARDGDLNGGGNLPTGNATLSLRGRGEHTEAVPVRVFGNPIPYTVYGLDINSSSETLGSPQPAPTPGNSTRIVIGSNSGASTQNEPGYDPQGIFNFLSSSQVIRVSVDYEIVWPGGAGRDMWINVNNNNPTQNQSVMGGASRILAEPLTAVEGTRATAVGYLSVPDIQAGAGKNSLETAFICIVALSNGGRVYVSGIRIEYSGIRIEYDE